MVDAPLDAETEAIRYRLLFEAEQAEKAMKRSERQLLALEQRYDPMSRATKKLERDQKLLAKSLANGNIDAARHARLMEEVQREYRDTEAQIKRATVAVQAHGGAQGRLGGFMRQNRSIFQQAGFQVGDFAVQMQGGTSALTAFTQQGSQLLGAFGAFGAVAGATLAIVAPLASSFFDAAEEAATLEDALKGLESAVSRLKDAQGALVTDDLAAEFGADVAAAREMLQIQKELAAVQAQRAVGLASSGLVDAFGGVDPNLTAEGVRNVHDSIESLTTALEAAQIQIGDTVDRPASELANLEAEIEAIAAEITALRDVGGVINDLADRFQLTKDEAQELLAALAALRNAEGAREQAAAAADLARHIFEATDGLQAADDEALALYQQMLDVQSAALEVASINISAPIAAAASEAARLADALSRARAEQGALGEINRDNPDFFDPRGEGANAGRTPVERANPQPAARRRAATEANRSTRSGRRSARSRGGGNASRAADREQAERMREGARLYQQTRSEAEKYSLELARLNELHGSGAIDADVFSRAVTELNTSFEANQLKPIRDTIQGLSTDLLNAARSGRTAKEVLLNFLLDNAIRAAANSLSASLSPIFGGLFSFGSRGPSAASVAAAALGGGGLFEKGAAFSGGQVVPFAAGGVVSTPTLFPMSQGRTGLMGEAGPEAIMPLARLSDGGLGVRAQSAGGGQSAVRVVLALADGVTVQDVEVISGEVAAEIVAENNLAREERDRRQVRG
ncbi:MAG: hypothetical protein AAGF30_00350 [Pseudomonadota bacterium]